MLETASRGANRFHNRARSITGKQSSQITVSTPLIPNQVEPARRYDAGADIVNDASVISPTDPNACNPGALFVGGLNVRLELKVDGTTVDSATDCVPGLGGRNSLSLSWSTPSVQETTEFEVVYEARGVGNDELLDRITRTVTVTQTAPAPGDGGGGGNCNRISDVLSTPGCSITDVVPLNALAAGAGGILFLLVLIALLGP